MHRNSVNPSKDDLNSCHVTRLFGEYLENMLNKTNTFTERPMNHKNNSNSCEIVAEEQYSMHKYDEAMIGKRLPVGQKMNVWRSKNNVLPKFWQLKRMLL